MKFPITIEFNDANVVGYVELTPEFQKEYEELLIKSNDPFVISPAYVTNDLDKDKATKADLFSFGVIPASRAYNDSTKEKKDTK